MGLEHETQYYFLNKNPHAVKGDAVVCLTKEYLEDILGADLNDKPYYKELSAGDIKEIDDIFSKIKSDEAQYRDSHQTLCREGLRAPNKSRVEDSNKGCPRAA